MLTRPAAGAEQAAQDAEQGRLARPDGPSSATTSPCDLERDARRASAPFQVFHSWAHDIKEARAEPQVASGVMAVAFDYGSVL